MKRPRNAFYAKPLAICLIASLIAVSTAAKSAQAMFLPAVDPDESGIFNEQVDAILITRRALESRIIEQRLRNLGLSPNKAQEKINALSDEQIRKVAANIDFIDAGGQMHGGIHGSVGVSGYVYGPVELTVILLLILLIVVTAQEDTSNGIG